MSKIIMVETVSMFRIRYAVEINDEDPNEHALDTVVCEVGLFDEYGKPLLEEMSQEHIDEVIVSHREISKEEFLKIFTEDNDNTMWSDDMMQRCIHRRHLNES